MDVFSSLKHKLPEPRDVLEALELKLFFNTWDHPPLCKIIGPGQITTRTTTRKSTFGSTAVLKLHYYSNISTLKNWILTLCWKLSSKDSRKVINKAFTG